MHYCIRNIYFKFWNKAWNFVRSHNSIASIPWDLFCLSTPILYLSTTFIFSSTTIWKEKSTSKTNWAHNAEIVKKLLCIYPLMLHHCLLLYTEHQHSKIWHNGRITNTTMIMNRGSGTSFTYAEGNKTWATEGILHKMLLWKTIDLNMD